MSKVYTGYCGTSEIEHGLCACTVDNPLAKARGLSLRTGAQTMLYLSLEPLKFYRTSVSAFFLSRLNHFSLMKCYNKIHDDFIPKIGNVLELWSLS